MGCVPTGESRRKQSQAPLLASAALEGTEAFANMCYWEAETVRSLVFPSDKERHLSSDGPLGNSRRALLAWLWLPLVTHLAPCHANNLFLHNHLNDSIIPRGFAAIRQPVGLVVDVQVVPVADGSSRGWSQPQGHTWDCRPPPHAKCICHLLGRSVLPGLWMV